MEEDLEEGINLDRPHAPRLGLLAVHEEEIDRKINSGHRNSSNENLSSARKATDIRCKSNQNQKRETTHMSNKNQFFY
jgi:hypothetical protein